MQIFKKLFGSRNERVLRRIQKLVTKINALEPTIQALSDDQLSAKTAEFRARLTQGATLDSLLTEAFAVVREASRRVLHMRHFDVQLIGGIVLHEGSIAEMRTGEGKTLMATLAAYLNALPSEGVHVITVNDYLAKRDADWMRPVYEFLGLSVGIIISNMALPDKQKNYNADITYGTNNEFGFDYLRDNMAFSLDEKMQRTLNYAIVDEVDSILIDESRTPLIISGPAEESSDLYSKLNALVPQLARAEQPEPSEPPGPGDFLVDEKAKQVHLTEAGHEHIEALLITAGLLAPDDSLYAANNVSLLHHLSACLRAHHLFRRDVDYIVRDNQVIIVDEHTGRTMIGRRWSDGLHQAIEAKEKVSIQNENQTLASITFQNYFRIYRKLAGMTGTADTEAFEFRQIYNLDVVVIPTNKPMIRKDEADQIYLTRDEKFKAILEDIKSCRARGQPVLVGTIAIETSEYLSDLLTKANVAHQVLNAKFHEQEAHIVAQAGRPGAVTIATNMAGRGTDIVLGGNFESDLQAILEPTEFDVARLKAEWQERHKEVLTAGGLRIIGTERHESRRIDNQLRGRSGRQGDPGSSRFYLSLQDNLMRIFASDRVAAIMQRLGMQAGESIEHPWVTKAIENAQRKVEGHHFDVRKQLLQYDDVANDQRKVIYQQRAELMAISDISDNINTIMRDVIMAVINRFIPPDSLEEQWDIPGLEQALQEEFHTQLPIHEWLEQETHLHETTLRERIYEAVHQHWRDIETQVGTPMMRSFEKSVMLRTLDSLWKEHLAAMDYLRQGIHLRGYAQQNPAQEYKRESFNMFTNLLTRLKHEVISTLCKVQVQAQEPVPPPLPHLTDLQTLQFQHPEFTANDSSAQEPLEPSLKEQNPNERVVPFIRETKTGRNDLCPCGSGQKYKRCHGQLEA